MVFRRDNKVDAFQRQISALRHQLGPDGGDADDPDAPIAPERREPDVRTEADAAAAEPERERPRPRAGYRPRDGAGYSFADFGVASPAPDTASPDLGEAGFSPSPPELPTADAETSVVAVDAQWKGDLQSGAPIHVHGRVEGTITSRQDVFVAETATVDGTITAVNVVVAGRVSGSVACENRFEALPQGRVTADVHAPTVVVHEGAILTGGFRMGASAAESPEAEPTPVVHRRATRGGS